MTGRMLSALLVRLIALCSLLCLFLATVCFLGYSATISVPGDYPTIQAAIDAASPGDVILLSEGVGVTGTRVKWADYDWGTNTLHIRKSLTLRGMGISRSVLQGGLQVSGYPYIIIEGDAIHVIIEDVFLLCDPSMFSDPDPFMWGGGPWVRIKGAPHVEFRNVRITNYGNDHRYAAGIQVSDASHVEIDSVDFSFVSKAVEAYGESNLSIRNCTISATYWGITWASSGLLEAVNVSIKGNSIPDRVSPTGVSVSSGQAVMEDCDISSCAEGVRIYSSECTLRNAVVHSNTGTGIRSQDSSLEMSDCEIRDNEAGVICSGGRVEAENCTIQGNEENGLSLGSAEGLISNCRILGNEAGISLDGTARAIITDSAVKNNDGWGIAARGSAVAVGWRNTVTGNQRDLFGVSDWLVKPEHLADKQEISVPREMTTIEEAIYRVVEGGTVVVESGDYSQERVAIYKRINLDGHGHDVVVGGITLFNELGDVHASNLTIVGDTDDVGILVPSGNHFQLEDSVILKWGTGLRLLPGSTATVSNSTISENRTGIEDYASALLLRGCSMSLNGLQAIDSSSEDLRIDDCAIRDNGKDYPYAAISFSGKSALIENSIIEGNNSFGVEVGSGSCDIESCSISENGAGVDSSGTLVISGSRIMNNREYGICASRGDVTVISTEVALNKYGVFLGDGGEYIENLVGRNICIRDNSSADLRPSIEQYPWPREFEECEYSADVEPPPLVGDFAIDGAEGEDVSLTLTWTNPVDSELAQVRVCRKADSWPTDHSDGDTIYENLDPASGAAVQHVDRDQTANHTYYYAVFSADSTQNWNDAVQEGENAQLIAIAQALPDQPPNCALRLHDARTGGRVSDLDVGQRFEICLEGSEDDQAIQAVRFSSDEVDDEQPTGDWTDWNAWVTSEEDWVSTTRTKRWSFATPGQKELWVEVRDAGGNSTQCSTSIFVHPGYAIIVAGQGGWREKRGLDHSANNAYKALRNLGFDDDHILYLNSVAPQDIDDDGDDEVDGDASLDTFTDAIRQVAEATSESATPVLIYLVGHGYQDCFIFDEDDSESGFLWVGQTSGVSGFAELLSQLAESVPCAVMIGSCYSGCFIATSEASPGSISAERRMVVTSCHDDEERALWGWVRSSDTLWGDLMIGSDLRTAFENRSLPGDITHLWLDDNGDTIGHPPNKLGDDGDVAKQFQIGVPGSDSLALKSWLFYWLRSPGELRVCDTDGRITGLVDGEISEEIPGSLFDVQNNIVVMFDPPDSYYCEVVGTAEGTYDLDCVLVANGKDYAVAAAEMPTLREAVHRYSVDWNVITQGGEGVILQVDAQGDNQFEETYRVGQQFSGDDLQPERTSTPDTSAKGIPPWVIAVAAAVVILLIALLLGAGLRSSRRSS